VAQAVIGKPSARVSAMQGRDLRAKSSAAPQPESAVRLGVESQSRGDVAPEPNAEAGAEAGFLFFTDGAEAS
jgi:hypothetical protein